MGLFDLACAHVAQVDKPERIVRLMVPRSGGVGFWTWERLAYWVVWGFLLQAAFGIKLFCFACSYGVVVVETGNKSGVVGTFEMSIWSVRPVVLLADGLQVFCRLGCDHKQEYSLQAEQ